MQELQKYLTENKIDDDVEKDARPQLEYPFITTSKHEPQQRVYYNTHYVATHKDSVTAVSLSQNGKFLISGSQDKCLKLFYVPMLRKTTSGQSASEQEDDEMMLKTQGSKIDAGMQLKPVMESYYVHQQGITALTFH
ncbi:MAG: hypothetical protein EZS28_043085, partial [Streblomastix strix]